MTVTYPIPFLPLTFDQAGMVIEFTCKAFAAEIPPAGYSEAEIQTLARRVSFYLDADVRWQDLDSIIESMRDLADLETGDHPDLIHTRSGIYDEFGEIADRINRVLKAQISYALGQAGIHRPARIAV